MTPEFDPMPKAHKERGEKNMTKITWDEKIVAISVNPGMARLKDIADIAAELIEIKARNNRAEKFTLSAYGFKSRADFTRKINEWWIKDRPAIVWVWGGDKK